MFSTPRDDLMVRLEDPEYAKLYGEEHARVEFAVTLTKARKNLELTQKELSEKLGISQPYIAKLEGGEANPTLGTIGRILATIGLKLVTRTAPLKKDVQIGYLVFPDALSAAGVKEESGMFRWYTKPDSSIEAVLRAVGTASEVPQSAGTVETRREDLVAGGV